jgi:hypothetical protein
MIMKACLLKASDNEAFKGVQFPSGGVFICM